MRLFLSALLVFISFSVINAQEKATIILKSGFSNLCYIHSIDSNYVHYTALGIEGDPSDSVLLSQVQSISFVEHFAEPYNRPGDSIRISGNIYSIDPASPLSAMEKQMRQKHLKSIYQKNFNEGRAMVLSAKILLPASFILGAASGFMISAYSNEDLWIALGATSLLLAIPSYITGNVLLPIGLDKMARAKAAKSLMTPNPPTLSFHPSEIKGGFGNMAYGAGVTLNF